MTIRQATLSDLSALVALNQVVHALHVAAHPGIFRRDPPGEEVTRAFKTSLETSNAHWLVAEERQIVAFANADFNHRVQTWCVNELTVCYINTIVVSPDFRRKGITKALLSELIRTAHARGITQIELDVWSFNQDAKKAFAALGFEPIKERMALPHHRAPRSETEKK